VNTDIVLLKYVAVADSNYCVYRNLFIKKSLVVVQNLMHEVKYECRQ